MTIDTYAICPCGNGKKIKFCKCKDSVGELDSVLSMVEGGQIVPALDRLSSILQQNPDAAWALAIRGRLLLDLREYDSLAENAERFIRLQPSNPMALTQRAAALLFNGDTEAATATLLEALTESGRSVDSFVLDVSTALGLMLAQTGAFFTARVYATLAMMTGNQDDAHPAVSVLRQLNQSPAVNQLVKLIPESIPRPSDASWGERYDEADALLRSNQVLLAENKFESLSRTNTEAPSILSGLLTCAIWRGDTGAQADLLKKLSDCESLDLETRAKYLAMSALADPSASQLSLPTTELTAEISNADEVLNGMTAHSHFVSLPADLISNMRVNEEDVPPRAGFQILDREKPAVLDQLPAVDDVPESIAMVLIYGKQTDREARIEVREVRPSQVDDVKAKINDAIGSEQDFQQSQGESMSLLVASQPPVAMVQFRVKPGDARKLQNELATKRMPENIVHLKLPILDGSSLSDLADDSSKLLQRTAVIRVIEHYDALSAKLGDSLKTVYDLAGLTMPEMIPATNDQAEQLRNEELMWVDPSALDAESLLYLLQRAQQVSSSVALRRFARTLLDTEMTEQQQAGKLIAYLTLIQATDDPDDALEMVEQAKTFAEEVDLPIGQILLIENGLRLQIGDGEGFQRTIQQLTSKYGQDPEVMAQLQQQLMAFGLIGPDGRPRGAPAAAGSGVAAAPAAQSGSGLWTPESGSAPSPPPSPAAEPESSGGGKIWLPGMD